MGGGAGPGGSSTDAGAVRDRGEVSDAGMHSPDPRRPPAAEWRTVSSTGGGERKRRTRKRGGGLGGGPGAGPVPVPAPRSARPGRVAEGGDRGDSRPGRATGEGGRAPRVVPSRPPRAAAVTTTREEGGPSYAEVLRKARERISLADININRTRIRRAATEVVVIEIPGEDNKQKADELARRLDSALSDLNVRVARPVRMTELRVSGLDDSISREDVALALGEVGGASWLEIKTGEIRRNQRGMGAMWASCPLETTIKVAGAGRIAVGWSSARVELLRRRPLRCFRCLAAGHVRTRCPSAVDRSMACHNCGQVGHLLRECRSAPKCPACEERGLDIGHRIGGEHCRPIPPGRSPAIREGAAERRTAEGEGLGTILGGTRSSNE